MRDYVLLLRGINVGGHNRLPMAQLRELLAAAGCHDVATYIQSGNAVLRHQMPLQKLSGRISDAITAECGFTPTVMLLPAAEFRAILAANPFKNEEPGHVHAWILGAPAPDAGLARIAALAAESERYELTGKAFFLHAPLGIGRSKLASGVEKCLGVDSTARNGRTLARIADLLDA